jgi:flagellar biosynthesis protein FliR
LPFTDLAPIFSPVTGLEDLTDILPDILESLLVLSAPTQYGQLSIDELVQGMLARVSPRLRMLKAGKGLEVNGTFSV